MSSEEAVEYYGEEHDVKMTVQSVSVKSCGLGEWLV